MFSLVHPDPDKMPGYGDSHCLSKGRCTLEGQRHGAKRVEVSFVVEVASILVTSAETLVEG